MGFFSGFIFFPPISFELTRYYHALLNALSLVILAVFAYQIGKPYGKSKSWFTIVSCLSISSHSTTLGVGQYGIIVNALLISMFWLLNKKHDFLAGIFLGFALLKPSISGLYIFVFVVKKRINAVFTFCLYIIITSSIIGIVVKVSPIYMIKKMITVSQYYVSSGYSGINFVIAFGVSPLISTISLAVIASVIIIGIFYLFKDNSLLFFFAIACVICRLFTYHLIYDNVMLVFLLLALICLTFDKPNKSNILMLIFVLLSLSLPPKVTDLPFVAMIQIIIWFFSLLYLIISQKEFKHLASL